MATAASFTCGATRTWIGPDNGTWTDGSANDASWSGSDEPDADDDGVFSASKVVSMGSANSISSLSLSNGATLNMGNQVLAVDLLTQLSGANTTLIVGAAGAGLTSDNVAIHSGATLSIQDGVVNVAATVGNGSFTVDNGAVLSGFGTINLNDNMATPAALLINDGQLNARRVGATSFSIPPAGTLAINAFDSDARIDLDGVSGSGSVRVFRNQTLDINLPLSDAFSGIMTLDHNAHLEMASAWSMDAGSFTVGSGFKPSTFTTPAISADVAYLDGGDFTLTGGTLSNSDSDGTLQFNGRFFQTGGALVNNGLLIFNNDAVLSPGTIFSAGGTTASVTVNAGRTVTINQTNYDFDGGATQKNVTTVNAGAVLNLNLPSTANQDHRGVLRLNGGTLNVTTHDHNWDVRGQVQAGANSGASHITGDVVRFAGASLSVGAGATLNVDSSVVLDANSTYAGAGTLRLNNLTYFAGNATIDTLGFDWDGDSSLGAHTIADNVVVTINSSQFDDDGAMDDAIILGGGTARLNVNSGSQWLVRNTIDTNVSKVSRSTIGGTSRMVLSSATAALKVHGDTYLAAPVTFAQGSTTTIDAGAWLVLQGADTRIAGGTIGGAGQLRSEGGGVRGFGTVNLNNLIFESGGIFADDGTLTVGSIQQAGGGVGTADEDAILNVVNPWTSYEVNSVHLAGGEIRGGDIDLGNFVGLSGYGLVTARVINGAWISQSGVGRTLVMQTPGNNSVWDNLTWDGGGARGAVSADQGTLDLRDNADYPFRGNVLSSNGGVVFTNGFAFNFQAESTLRLTGGKFKSTAGTRLGGHTAVSAGSASEIEVQAGQILDFAAGGTTTLNGTLNLRTNNAVVRPNAVFDGPGALHVLDGSLLNLEHGASLGTLIQNDGIVDLAGMGVGRIDVKDFEQSATAELRFDILGSPLSQYDRLVASGGVFLQGTLDVNVLGGFAPALGQTFNILSAANGVSGTFSAVHIAGMPSGMTLSVTYTPTSVQLQSILGSAFSADFNHDGHVDAGDLLVWKGAMGVNALADTDGDGDSDGNDFLTWQRQLDGGPSVTFASASTASAVPEPASLVLAAAATAMAVSIRRRR